MAEDTNPKYAKATAQKDAKPPVHAGVLARFPRALKAIAEVSRAGTEKRGIPIEDISFLYDPESLRRYREARARHILDEAIEGPVNSDPADQGALHATQCAWDALAVLEIMLYRAEQAEKEKA